MRQGYRAGGDADARSSFSGYMTLEASFIVPLTVLLMAALIWLSFFMYDRCAFEGDAYVLCLRESMRKDASSGASRMLAAAQAQFGKKYFGTEDLAYSGSESGGCLRMQGSARVLRWTIPFSASAARYDPPARIRTCRRLFRVTQMALGHLSGDGG